MTGSTPPARRSFSELALYTACPLKYRLLRVEGQPEPTVPPDWSRAPRALPPAAVASALDRTLGVAVHAALARWQRAGDAGGSRRTADLLHLARREAVAAGLDGPEFERALTRVEKGLRAYAEGPWPRQATIFLEHSVRHVLVAPDGFAVELHLRVDRVVRYRRAVAILDFKTVTPHPFEMRADAWQLRTYALAAPELLGVAPGDVRLVLIDLEAGVDSELANDPGALEGAAGGLLAAARGIAAAKFDATTPDRPCWACGFRLECPASLAPNPPRVRDQPPD